MNQSTNNRETPSFLEFCVLIMVKHLPGPTFNELLEHSFAYGLNEVEVRAGLVPLIKNKLIVPWSIYSLYSTFPFTGFMITNEGISSFSLNNIESRNILMEATGWLSAVFAKAPRTSHKIKVRKMLEDIYAAKFHKKPTVKNLKKNSRKVKDPLFAAEIYSIIAWHKLRTKNYSEAAHYYGSAAICYLRLNDKDHAKKCYFLAGKYFKRVRNVYSSLDCYYGAINFSKDVKEKQNLINQLPLPKEIIAKINPRNFKKDYWKVDKELESFIEKLLKITPTRTGGFLATLTNRFEEYFEEAINLNDGGKLMITSRIFYHMIEAFQVLIPESNLPEFEDYEISKKLEMSHRVGGFYYHVGEFFVEGYLPSKNVKFALLETYETINPAVVRPFVFIFDGMVTGGKNYDIGTKYEVLAWKNSDLANHLQKNINLVFEDIEKEKKIKEMVERRGCKIKEKSAQGKRIEKITKDYSNTYKKIFSICERESLFKILLNFRDKSTSKSELNNLGLVDRDIDLLVALDVFVINDDILTFNESFEQFWSSGDWLPAYLLLLLENENKIEFDFCVYIEDSNGASHEIDLIIGNKKNTMGLIECKTSERNPIGMNEIKKFFSAINMLEPIKYKYFLGYHSIEFNAERYSISKRIDAIGVKEISTIKKMLSKIVSEIIKDI